MHEQMTTDDATLHAGDLTASYKMTFRKQADDWVAIGSVTANDTCTSKPVWLIVGVGKLPSDALGRLQRALEREASRVRAQPISSFSSAD
jgi:hypothetical protein